MASITGTSGNDILTGTPEVDSIDGLGGKDILYGDAGNDTLDGGYSRYNGDSGDDILYGGTGNDTLTGGKGNDILAGAAGNDTLTGDGGSNQFLYNTGRAFRSTDVGVDVIKGLTHNVDKIVLDKTTFTTISGLSITNGEFQIVGSGNGATSVADIIYNSANGFLYYNQNGSAAGLGTGAQFATLPSSPAT